MNAFSPTGSSTKKRRFRHKYISQFNETVEDGRFVVREMKPAKIRVDAQGRPIKSSEIIS